VGGTPNGGDLPAEELEFPDNFQRPSSILMVILVEMKGIDCSLIVYADKYL
jgi:hypothetical protein